jgi:hypothetical protein
MHGNSLLISCYGWKSSADIPLYNPEGYFTADILFEGKIGM